MKKYISFGKFNAYYKFIISSVVFKLLYNLLFGVQIGYSTQLLRLLPENDFVDHSLIHDLFNYLGIFIISLILLLCDKIYTKKKVKEPEVKSKPRISLIHNEVDFDIIDGKLCINLLIITFLWVLMEQSEKIYYYCTLNDLDYWPCEMLILAYFCKKMFGKKLYKHQKFSIFFILIVGSLLKFGSFIISLHIDDQDILFIQRKFWIPLGIIFFLIIIFFRSYVSCKLKWIIDYKYIFVIKLMILYGFSGIIVNSLICLIATYSECNSDKCAIKSSDGSERHYESFLIYLEKMATITSNEKFIEILYIILASLFNFFVVLNHLLIIKYLSPIHTICSGAIYYILIQIILIIVNKIKNNNFFKGEENQKDKAVKYLFDISSDFFSAFSTTIFLELIELNFCGCNYNLRKNIIERSKLDGTTVDDIENGSLVKDNSIYNRSTVKSSDYSRQITKITELSVISSHS
jgi:hypothetical protein